VRVSSSPEESWLGGTTRVRRCRCPRAQGQAGMRLPETVDAFLVHHGPRAAVDASRGSRQALVDQGSRTAAGDATGGGRQESVDHGPTTAADRRLRGRGGLGQASSSTGILGETGTSVAVRKVGHVRGRLGGGRLLISVFVLSMEHASRTRTESAKTAR
jgi:hypothetical protein